MQLARIQIFVGKTFADNQHVKCDSKPQVTSMAYITGMFSSCLEWGAMSLDSHVISETTVLWFLEMILATDKITDNQRLALVAQSHPKSNLTCMAMTSREYI